MRSRPLRRVGGAAIASWLALAAGPAGCAPTLVHRARSADRAHVVTVTRSGGTEVLAVDGLERARGTHIAVEHLRWREGRPIVPVRDARGSWLLGLEDPPRWLEIGELEVSGAHVAYEAADRAGWHVVLDGRVGPAVPALARGTLVLGADHAAAVGLDGGRELVVTEEALGPGLDDVRALAFVAKGRTLAYVARDRGRDALVLDGRTVLAADEILEHAVADDLAAWAAIVGDGELVALVRGGPVPDGDPSAAPSPPLLRAALLTHLRISSDGEHVACLVPALEGGSIALARDGRILSQHRRAEGASLTFVPGTDRLALVIEESQGPEVLDGEWRSERFESIEALVVAPGTLGFVGRRGGLYEVWVGRERMGAERWAGSLVVRSAPSADGAAPRVEHAYVARDETGARAVVTRRGRWPVPRLFVDTLRLDESGRHWAALAPSPDEGRFEVWIDGEPRASVEAAEVGSELAVRGPLAGLADVAAALVETELERHLAAARR